MKKEIPNKDGWASSYVFPANFWAMLKGLPASTRLMVYDAICAFGIEGVKCKTGDPLADSLLEGIYMQMENMKGYGQRRKRGGQQGNQNARKHWNADGGKEGETSLFEGAKNETNANEYKTNKNEYQNECKTNTLSNSLNNSDLDKTNKTNKNEYATNIKEDKISLDNTSHLTELVLSKQEKINKKEKSETAPATLEGGAAPSFSETRNDFSRDYNARVSAMIGRGVSATPQPPSDISKTLQSPPPPTPAPVCGGKYEIREGDDETMRNIKTQCKAEVARAEDERGAEAKGGPLPKSAGRIRSNDILHDDSKEAEIERERAILEQYEAKAKDMEEDEETRRLFKDLADKLKTKITNYESTKNETKVGEGKGKR